MTATMAMAIAVFLAVVGLGGAVMLARATSRSRLATRLYNQTAGQTAAGDSRLSPAAGAGRTGGLLYHIGRAVSPHKPTEGLRQRLAWAGYHSAAAAPVFLGAKMVLLFGGLLALAFLSRMVNVSGASRLLLTVGGAFVLSLVPNMVIHRRRECRRNEIRRHLPDALDLLEICVSAGMGLELAWNSVAEDIRQVSPVLADEMALTNLEAHLGAPTATAMRHMADRTGVQDVASLTAAIVQSERFGTSIADALRTFAVGFREERGQRAQEAAEKLAVKLIFPMVLFIFPAVVIVMAGPALIKLLRALS